MSVYMVEIPNNSPVTYSDENVAEIIRKAFAYTNVKIEVKHSGTIAELKADEDYNMTMAGE